MTLPSLNQMLERTRSRPAGLSVVHRGETSISASVGAADYGLNAQDDRADMNRLELILIVKADMRNI